MEIDQIKGLAELMVANDLTKIEFREGELHILITRVKPGAPVLSAPPVAYPAVMPASPTSAAAPVPSASSPVKPGGPADNGEMLIRSPMVGTYYASADPESPPFIKVGDVVGPDSVVCLVEAMKVFNEIKAETTGRVVRTFVKSGDPVEFDQPLFAVEAA